MGLLFVLAVLATLTLAAQGQDILDQLPSCAVRELAAILDSVRAD